MNILLEKMPQEITISGIGYPINTDFRTWMKFELLIDNRGISPEDKFINMIKMCMQLSPGDKLPPTAKEIVVALCNFYAASPAPKNNGHKEETKQRQKRIYSFDEDADYIYAAFLTQYGIDLQQVEYLHWWKFIALFKSLADEHKIMKIMEYRSVDLNQIKDKDRRAFYRKMKALYKLPDNRTEEEKHEDMINSLSSLF